ncbi:MAG: hypothetical protein ACFFKA_21270 [Candidatus Thorarchaeota archaeon]
MLYYLLQMGTTSYDMNSIFFIIGLLVADFVLLKIGLTLTKAERWKRMKWVAASYFIQFGTIFIIGSPLMILGMIGVFQGDIVAIIPVVIVSAFIDMNVINVIHRIGLKSSLIIVIMILVPMIFIMSQLGSIISMFMRL